MKITVSKLMEFIKNAIEMHFENEIWLIGTIASKTTSLPGHVYIELADMSERGETLSKVKANLWKTDAVIVERKFKEGVGEELKESMKVLVKVKVSFHEKFGLSVTIKDIDPSFTMGGIEAKLTKMRERLKNEDLYERNREFDTPFDYFKIGIISPRAAAGLEDFKVSIKAFEDHGIISTMYEVATFQGETTEKEIVSAIKKLDTLNLDAVLIIRGGGSKLDLDYLNSYEIAKAIANSKHPYISGIGHEIDSTIIDEVVKIKCGTPSKVAELIVNVMVANATRIHQNMEYIGKNAKIVIKEYEKELQIKYGIMVTSARIKIEKEKAYNTAIYTKIIGFVNQKTKELNLALKTSYLNSTGFAKKTIKIKKQELDSAYRGIYAQSPENTLKKGYAVLRKKGGKVVSQVSKIKKGDKLKIQMRDGAIDVKVEES